MDKQALLSELRQLAASGQISSQEVLAVFPQTEAAEHRGVNVAQILYYVGAAIVFLGIATLIGQNWEVLPSITRIVVTFGSGIAAYVIGVLYHQYRHIRGISAAAFLLAAMLLPMGTYVWLFEGGVPVERVGIAIAISAAMFVVFLASRFLFQEVVHTIFSIIFGTCFYGSVISWLIALDPTISSSTAVRIFIYWALTVGLVYMILGYAFRQAPDSALKGVLYAFGILTFLGAGLGLGGWSPDAHVLWELAFPLLALGAMFVSLYIKSRAFLTFGALYLMGYILKITAEYFADSIGWSLALVIAGLTLIGVGYFAFYLSRKYLHTTQTEVIQ